MPEVYPTVDLIIPTHNSASTIDATLRSVLAMNYAKLRIIIVDDGSSDDTRHRLAQYPEIELIKQSQQGAAAARNAGWAVSRAEFVSFLDADDLCCSSKLDEQLAVLLADPSLDFVLSRVENFVDAGVTRPSWIDYGGNIPLQVGAALFRRTMLERCGAFDPSFGFGEDIDFFLRLLDAEPNYRVLDTVHLRRRIHGNNQSYDREASRAALFRGLARSIARRQAIVETPGSTA